MRGCARRYQLRRRFRHTGDSGVRSRVPVNGRGRGGFAVASAFEGACMILSRSFRGAAALALVLFALTATACGGGSDKPPARDKDAGRGGSAGTSAAAGKGGSDNDIDRGGGLIDAGSPDQTGAG